MNPGLEDAREAGQPNLEAGSFVQAEGSEDVGVYGAEVRADPCRDGLPLAGEVQPVEATVGRVAFAGQPPPPLHAPGEPAHRALLGRLPIAIAEASAGLRIDGVDQSPNMIERARHNTAAAGLEDRVTFGVGDVADLPYPDDTFDLVVSSASQHHWADVPGGVRELGRVVRPAGRVWIYDFRFALRRAEAAARVAFPRYDVRRETVRTGLLPVRFIGRLVIEPA